ncbi:MAG: hypothetical protein AAF215_15600 [Cyanobacteria bacterium P01_A01_bin.123]
MFYSRRINKETQKVEVWECEWSNKGTGMAKKEFLRRIGDEEDIEFSHDYYSAADAVCWAPGRTIGNIAVSSEETFGMFEGKSGNDAVLPCQIIPAGKFRNGAKRWYCKTHQIHWGVKADYAAASESGEVLCSNYLTKMSYVVNPLEIEFKDFEEIGIWCSLPPALSTESIEKRAPKIHVHKRFQQESNKLIDRDFDAIVCSYNEDMGLFSNPEITKIQVTPPAAFEFVRSLEEEREMSCVTCKKCGYPHLDLGDFARKPHKKHFCGNCGNDSIWSPGPIVSTPLKPLHDQFSNSNIYIIPERVVNLDEYAGLRFELWASTPAVLWTASRPQEKGIHVHVYDKGRRVVDDTFGTVILHGQELQRDQMWENMVQNTLY